MTSTKRRTAKGTERSLKERLGIRPELFCAEIIPQEDGSGSVEVRLDGEPLALHILEPRQQPNGRILAWVRATWEGDAILAPRQLSIGNHQEVKDYAEALSRMMSQGYAVDADDFLAWMRGALDVVWQTARHGAGAQSEAIDVSRLRRPKPRRWLIDGIEPEGFTTVYYGPEATCKTYLAIKRAVCIASGAPFLRRSVHTRGPVLFLDWELDEQEFTRRAYEIATGMRQDTPPPGLHYLRMRAPLLESRDLIRTEAERVGAVALSVDSFSVAGCSEKDSANEAIQFLDSLPPTAAVLDHQARTQRLERAEDKRPYGTVFKEIGARSVWQLDPDKDSPPGMVNLVLRDQKSNFSGSRANIGVRVRFEDESVTILEISATKTPGLVEKLSATRRIEVALGKLGKTTAAKIEKETGLKHSSVKTLLSGLKKKGVVKDTPGAHPNDPHLWELTAKPLTRASTRAYGVDTTKVSTPKRRKAINAVNAINAKSINAGAEDIDFVKPTRERRSKGRTKRGKRLGS